MRILDGVFALEFTLVVRNFLLSSIYVIGHGLLGRVQKELPFILENYRRAGPSFSILHFHGSWLTLGIFFLCELGYLI